MIDRRVLDWLEELRREVAALRERIAELERYIEARERSGKDRP
jgi:hypothetical protein